MRRYLTIFALTASALAQNINAQDIPAAVVTDTSGLASSVASSPFDLLEGNVSGLCISYEDGNKLVQPDVVIRGLNSVRAGSMPLIVLDGIMLNPGASTNSDPFWQYEDKERFSPINPLSFLSAQDIEAIEILKDASATAMYGARGVNGVICITTKKGLTSGKKFEISTNFGVEKNNFDNNTNLSYRGKSGNTGYNISAFYKRQAGISINERCNYGGFKANVTSSVGKWLDFGCDLLFSGGATAFKNCQYPDDFDNDVIEYHGLFSTWFNIHFTKNLSLELKCGVDYQDNTRSVWYGSATPFGAEYGKAASKQSSSLLGYNARVKLEYDRYFSEKHRFRIGALGDFYGTKDELATLNGHGVLTEEVRANSISFLNSHFYPHAFKTDHNNIDAQAAVHYDFDGIAGMDASYRAVFSTEYTGSTPISLPSATAWLDLHKLCMPEFRGVSSLKLYGGYGVSALENVTPYDMLYTLTLPAILPVQEGAESFHKAITRVVAKEWHIGAEFSFLDGALICNAKYYDRISDDSYYLYKFGTSVDYKGSIMWSKTETGEIIDTYRSSIINKGVEVDIDAYPIRRKSVVLRLYSALSYNFNAVTDCEAEILSSVKGRTGDMDIITTKSWAVNSIYGYRLDGEQLRDITGEGTVTEADRVVLGQTVPVWNYSLGADLTLGRFTAEIMLSGAAGHKAVDYAAMLSDCTTALSEKYVLDGAYLRFSRIAAKYEIPIKPAKGEFHLSGLNLKAGVRDITLFGPYPTRMSFYLGVGLEF